MIKKALNKHPSSSSLNLSQMPALPPCQHEFFMFSLQVTFGLSQTFSEAMGGELRLFVLLLLTVPPLSQHMHRHRGAMGWPWLWNWFSLSHSWTWSLQASLGHGAPPQTFPWVSLCSWSHQWCETPRAEQADRNEDGSCISHGCGFDECLLWKGLTPARCSTVNYHGWDREEGPRLQMQGGWTVIFLLQLHCGLGRESRHEGLCPQPLQCKGCSLCCQ